MKVLLTGATGFIGSHIGDVLIKKGYSIVATYRRSSSFKNTQHFYDKTEWINTEEENWIETVIKSRPDAIIHSAWIGVKADKRDDLVVQSQNLLFLSTLLEIAKQCKCKKFIGLGSQAEYGSLEDIAHESSEIRPDTAYGIMKVTASKLVEKYCEVNLIDWYWLRLYSFFGEREDSSWLIPSLVDQLQNSSVINLTYGEQCYSYLYVRDLAKGIVNIIMKEGESGIYNMSGDFVISIRKLVEYVCNIVNPHVVLNFGALPYRDKQIMFMKGDTGKFNKAFGKLDISDFETILEQYVNSLINKC